MTKLFEIVPVKGVLTEEALDPSPEVPYFLIAQNGLYLHKPTVLGDCLLKQKSMPDHLGTIDPSIRNGLFTFRAPLVPAQVMGQVLNFFVRVYEQHKTEAEVLLTYHFEKKRYRVFVPHQRVTGASVKSIYDAANIQRGWQLIGTIHSHANMDAFHSGTDIDDASSLNGLHITIGNVNTQKPSYDAMVMINEERFNFDIEDVAEPADLTATAPDWWFGFVIYDEEAAKQVKLRNVSQKDLDKWSGKTQFPLLKPWQNKNNVSALLGDDDYGHNYLDWYIKHHGIGSDAPIVGKPSGVQRWSMQLQCYIPDEWYDTVKFEVKEEYFIDALEMQAKRLHEVAMKHGIAFIYDLIPDEDNLEDILDADVKPIIVENKKTKKKSKELLPGPMEVIPS